MKEGLQEKLHVEFYNSSSWIKEDEIYRTCNTVCGDEKNTQNIFIKPFRRSRHIWEASIIVDVKGMNVWTRLICFSSNGFLVSLFRVLQSWGISPLAKRISPQERPAHTLQPWRRSGWSLQAYRTYDALLLVEVIGESFSDLFEMLAGSMSPHRP
jgi:hypothetical protein